jgi:hypothetical protein
LTTPLRSVQIMSRELSNNMHLCNQNRWCNEINQNNLRLTSEELEEGVVTFIKD